MFDRRVLSRHNNKEMCGDKLREFILFRGEGVKDG